ncbi:hypothetical protein ACLOJK_019932 [Asimina triloba]
MNFLTKKLLSTTKHHYHVDHPVDIPRAYLTSVAFLLSSPQSFFLSFLQKQSPTHPRGHGLLPHLPIRPRKLPPRQLPKAVLFHGQAAEDQGLHPRPLHLHAPLLARPFHG